MSMDSDHAPQSSRDDRRLLRWLMRWARPYVPRLVFAAVLVILGSALRVAGPLLTAAAVDLYLGTGPVSAVSGGKEPAGPRADGPPAARGAALHVHRFLTAAGLPAEGAPGLTSVALLYLLSLLAAAIVLVVESRTVLMTGQYVMRDLRDALFAHLQKLDLAWFHRTPTGRVITRLTSDVEALNELFTSGLVEVLADLVLVSGIVAVLFALDWRLALLAFSVVPLQALLSLWFRRNARGIFREVRAKLAAVTTHLQEHLAGIAVVQLTRAESRTGRRFRTLDAEHRDVNTRGIFYYAVFYPMVEFLTSLGFALLLVFGGIWTTTGTLSLGVLVAFLQYVQRFYRPVADLAENYNIVQSSLAASERLHALLETAPAVAEPALPAPVPARHGTFSFEAVSFAYDGDLWAVRDLTFAAARGERLAVVGHTGAGKTTLVNLLLRFFEPQEGRILVNGLELRRWPTAELRRRFAVVLQEVDCFAGTLRDNVSLGRPDLDDRRLLEALEHVQAGPLLRRLPRGLDSLLGERGSGLSAGERQLVSFARALVGDPEFLILDEATAAVDAVTEDAIQRALQHLLVGRTALVIAHRLATVLGCDRVLVMHEGRLIEQGTHDQLLARGGLYRTLYDLQVVGARAESSDRSVV